jgi:putative membrane protein
MFSLFVVSVVFGNNFSITSFSALSVATIFFTLINLYLKPIIKIITLPINIFTLGLFTLFINAFILIIVEKFVSGFYIKDFSTAFFGAILLSIIYMVVEKFVIVRDENFYKKNYINQKRKNSINADDVIDVEGTYEDDKKR